jgi:type VI secretion system secreted protein VgrG
MALKQTDRLMQFSSTLGKDVLVIQSLEGDEGISRLFNFRAELLADVATPIDPKSLVGSKVAVAINLSDAEGARWINGIIASFEICGGDTEFNVFRARIVPAMWQLTLSVNCRVYQGKTALAIAKSVFGDYSLSVSDKTSEIYVPLDYCTQYSETDFHFVSRILEESGICYWFEHSDSDHKVVLSDSRTGPQNCPLAATIPFELNSMGAEGAYKSRISEFTSISTMVSGKHSSADYDYRAYARQDAAEQTSTSPFGKLNAFEQYYYPVGKEGYVKALKPDPPPGKAEVIENLFLESHALASDAVAEIFNGESNARSLCAGYVFTLSDYPDEEWNCEYLLTSVSLSAGQVPPYRTGEKSLPPGYSNHFSAMQNAHTYKPPITFVKPKIPGPQTAIVVAPSGEEMYIDKLGRINVQFLWDKVREANTVDNTYVRVAQQWAGNGWGTYFWPRLQDEVIVHFLNGDPDNPIVVGSVYNAVNVPKYALPDNSTRSGLVTRSSKNGGAANANELRFEDKKGSEQIFLNAESDMDMRIEKNHRRYVGTKDSLIVKAGQYEEIGADHHLNVKGNSVEKIAAKADINVGADLTQKIGGNLSQKIGMNHSEKVGMNYALDAGMQAYIKAGEMLVIESGMELCLKAAGGFISIGPAGVAISGTMVLINSGGAAASGSPGTVTDPKDPTAPDEADDGSKGGPMNS